MVVQVSGRFSLITELASLLASSPRTVPTGTAVTCTPKITDGMIVSYFVSDVLESCVLSTRREYSATCSTPLDDATCRF